MHLLIIALKWTRFVKMFMTVWGTRLKEHVPFWSQALSPPPCMLSTKVVGYPAFRLPSDEKAIIEKPPPAICLQFGSAHLTTMRAVFGGIGVVSKQVCTSAPIQERELLPPYTYQFDSEQGRHIWSTIDRSQRDEVMIPPEFTKQPTLAFSCGARSAFKLKEQDYLRSMLSRRQLQGLVGLRR